jgi:hypothetical protein
METIGSAKQDLIGVSLGEIPTEKLGVKEEAAIIRKVFRKYIPGVQVKMDRGTAYGWLSVRLERDLEPVENAFVTKVLGYPCSVGPISPEHRDHVCQICRNLLAGMTLDDALEEAIVSNPPREEYWRND